MRVRCVDPSREEMLTFLALPSEFGPALASGDACDFDVEDAIYWFANDWHSGGGSNLYSALSTSRFRPGILCDGCEPGSMAEDMYNALEGEYVNGKA